YQAVGMPTPAAHAADAFVSRPQAPTGTAHRSAGSAMPIAASVDELLLAGSDEAFVDQAYRTLLHRAPDTSGRDAMLALLRAGHRRTYVIHVMRASDEARKVGVNLAGMGKLPSVYRAASKLGRGPLRPLERALDRAYSAWRHVRIAVNGVGLRRLDRELRDRDQALTSLGSATQGLRGDISHVTGELERLRGDAQTLRAEVNVPQDYLTSLNDQVVDQGSRLAPLPQLAQEYRRELDLLRARINMLHRRTLPVQAATTPLAAAPSRDDLAARIDAYYVSFEEAHR